MQAHLGSLWRCCRLSSLFVCWIWKSGEDVALEHEITMFLSSATALRKDSRRHRHDSLTLAKAGAIGAGGGSTHHVHHAKLLLYLRMSYMRLSA